MICILATRASKSFRCDCSLHLGDKIVKINVDTTHEFKFLHTFCRERVFCSNILLNFNQSNNIQYLTMENSSQQDNYDCVYL